MRVGKNPHASDRDTGEITRELTLNPDINPDKDKYVPRHPIRG